MFKRLIIILAIVQLNLAFAMDSMNGIPTMPNPAQIINESVADIIDPPNTAALNIMMSALSSLKELKKSGKATPENIKSLIRIKLLPSIAMDVSTQLALKKHWGKLNHNQKVIFSNTSHNL
jgi:hypothetical protein